MSSKELKIDQNFLINEVIKQKQESHRIEIRKDKNESLFHHIRNKHQETSEQ